MKLTLGPANIITCSIGKAVQFLPHHSVLLLPVSWPWPLLVSSTAWGAWLKYSVLKIRKETGPEQSLAGNQ